MAVITELFENPYVLQGLAAAIFLVYVSHFLRDLSDGLPYKNIPLVGKSRWALSNTKAKERFVNSASELIQQGFAQGKSAFQAMFSHSLMIVLHPRLMNEVKSHPHLSFDEATKRLFFGGQFPGFEVFEGQDKDHIMLNIINKKITHTLGQQTVPLSKETASLLKDTFSESDEWQPFVFAKEIPHMVARLSSLVFMGEEICHNQEWLDVSVNYTIDSFVAARELRLWPAALRHVVHWFLPSAQKVRNDMRIARRIVQEEIEKRRLIREGKLPGKGEKTHPDVLDWIEEAAAGRPFNETRAQVGLALAAIHTTSNMLTNVLYDLTAYSEHIQPLRDEIKAVLEEDGGLKKTSLVKMKLLDSVMKETQRMNPAGMTSINRVAIKDVPLSDGTVIPKGAGVVVSGHIMRDDSVYPDAQRYDGYRFYNKRQEPGHEHRHQFVTTTPEHFGFGHGQHACPGRFFAANEIKIFLVHLLVKYDWKFVEQQGRPKNILHGTENICDRNVKFLFKPRQPEIDLALLGEGKAE